MTEYVYHGKVIATEVTESSVTIQLDIPENLYYFAGHFPSNPVLPGVVMTHWVMEYLTQHYAVDAAKFIGLGALKFQIIIRPKYQLTLVLKKLNDKKYSFSYSSEHGQHASGKVLFA
ncbi:acyl-CoA synthetase [Paraglaciecola aquimarina]|uniref:Acyl-CoA synthetase n=1 Tax=Paraglaciecola aquimarina TaxID=1235557 RepID=A0ABU3SSR6_9ALTE|nr:acyl-CoA synthetase [Paraglaciecola aquimarina]MDU0353054.1 acyl-CoA synthetase [Paraglaciecola aquimarina]